MEFVGDGIQYLSMDDRFTSLQIWRLRRAARTAFSPVDDLTKQYMEKHSKRPYVIYEADEDAEYEQEFTIDLSTFKADGCISASAGEHAHDRRGGRDQD